MDPFDDVLATRMVIKVSDVIETISEKDKLDFRMKFLNLFH